MSKSLMTQALIDHGLRSLGAAYVMANLLLFRFRLTFRRG